MNFQPLRTVVASSTACSPVGYDFSAVETCGNRQNLAHGARCADVQLTMETDYQRGRYRPRSWTPTIPTRIAYSASSVRSRKPSFWKMLLRCVLTVTSLI